jgi:hypothetical protein
MLNIHRPMMMKERTINRLIMWHDAWLFLTTSTVFFQLFVFSFIYYCTVNTRVCWFFFITSTCQSADFFLHLAYSFWRQRQNYKKLLEKTRFLVLKSTHISIETCLSDCMTSVSKLVLFSVEKIHLWKAPLFFAFVN